jgi:hypothetical protein
LKYPVRGPVQNAVSRQRYGEYYYQSDQKQHDASQGYGLAGFALVLFVRMIFGETRYVEAFEQRMTERAS